MPTSPDDTNSVTSPTQAWYDTHADTYADATRGVDMGPLYARFLAGIPAGGRILDAGCGSGRDARAFREAGYAVSAFDATPALAARASAWAGIAVDVQRFETFIPTRTWHGIWACASLLHVRRADLLRVLGVLWTALEPGGSLYVSFKQGAGERVEDGRHFTDLDEAALYGFMDALGDVDRRDIWLSEDRRGDRTQVWVNGVFRRSSTATRRLTTGGDDHLLPKLAHEIARAGRIDVSVSFVMASGLSLLMPDLLAALQPDAATGRVPARMRILTCDYLGVTDIEACRLLMLLKEQGADVRVYQSRNTSFHMKAWIFTTQTNAEGVRGVAYVGSSNISQQALQHALEWNYRIDYPEDHGFLEAHRAFERIFADPRSIELTHEWINDYQNRRPIFRPSLVTGVSEPVEPPTPSPIQKAALDALRVTRAEGYRRGLVVLATGLGKTWLSAFDADHMGAKRVLFVAHREEILTQAAVTFARIMPQKRVGFYAGAQRDVEADVLCASIQTLGKDTHLNRFGTDHFDYIVVDEFHHAAASQYRRLLAHFSPRFLLGLTATPERTDQSDILSLCDDNLVYECPLFDGIREKLLAPFHYYGIFDETVEYAEIPWRNGRFDPEDLTHRLATEGRARHVLKEWRQHKQRRTLAFCVSTRHADFMAERFREAGIAAHAVHGKSAIGRTEGLEALRCGEAEVLFSVDLFNEGVDLPEIDTVMMLRPTESKVLFLQQLGRGLRRCEGKERLVVLDFIGNHRSFLNRPVALFQLSPGREAVATLMKQLQAGQMELPEGCFVNFDLRAIEFLIGPTPIVNIETQYVALRDTLGHRPTLSEAWRAGLSLQTIRKDFGSWFELVSKQKDLTVSEAAVAEQHRAVLRELETTSMTRCYKMILLEAFQELDGWRTPPTLEVLAERSWKVMLRRRQFWSELPDWSTPAEAGHGKQWERHWRDNPINAWTGGNTEKATALFEVRDGRFSSRFGVADVESWQSLVQEVVEYRLASYEYRKVAGSAPVNLGGAIQRKKSDKIYFREEIPALFDVEFNPGNWNSGHVVLKEQRVHVLLVTLNKQGKSVEHRYVDHWIDEYTFHWQSQNSTTPTSSKGRSIIDHERLGWEIHLFVRDGKLSAGKGAPFEYVGKVRYVRHEGAGPMSVVFEVLG